MKGDVSFTMSVKTSIDPDMVANMRRALSQSLPLMPWPPAIGMRVHYNSGWPRTSWTGEIRGVIDDDVAVVWRRSPAYGRARWALLTKVEAGISKPRVGPLPRALTKKEP